jgi:hypothetical protein
MGCGSNIPEQKAMPIMINEGFQTSDCQNM